MAHRSTYRAALGYVSSDAMLPKARREDLRSRSHHQYRTAINSVSLSVSRRDGGHYCMQASGEFAYGSGTGPPFPLSRISISLGQRLER